MKYLCLLAITAALYYFVVREAPVAPVADALASAEAAPLLTGPKPGLTPGTNSLKRPLDRTHAVLDQARTRASEDF